MLVSITARGGRNTHERPAGGAAPPTSCPAGERLRNVAVVCVIFFALGFATYFGYALWQISQRVEAGRSAPNDMSVFWGAAKIGLEGNPSDAFDVGRLGMARSLPTPDELPPRAHQMAWSYPPQFHALVLPLGLMPFPLAWIVWGLAGIAAFWFAMRRLVPDRNIVTVVCASPAVLMCAIQGQNSSIFAALLAGLLLSLRAGRPATAGLLLGALTIKPQFGPLLPLALLSAGAWRVMGFAIIAGAAIVGLTLVWPGPGYWLHFFEGLAQSGERMASGWLPRELMISWYAFAVAFGAAHETALAIQLWIMALLATAVVWAWLGGHSDFALRGAVLSIAVPLFSPYVYYYDLVLPLIGVALALWGGYVRRSAQGISMAAAMALVWAAPTLGHLGIHAGIDFAFAQFTPPILTAFLLLTLREIALSRTSSALPGRVPGS